MVGFPLFSTVLGFSRIGKRLMGGGKTYRAISGGRKRTIFWRAPKVGFVWSVHVPSKENDIA